MNGVLSRSNENRVVRLVTRERIRPQLAVIEGWEGALGIYGKVIVFVSGVLSRSNGHCVAPLGGQVLATGPLAIPPLRWRHRRMETDGIPQ